MANCPQEYRQGFNPDRPPGRRGGREVASVEYPPDFCGEAAVLPAGVLKRHLRCWDLPERPDSRKIRVIRILRDLEIDRGNITEWRQAEHNDKSQSAGA